MSFLEADSIRLSSPPESSSFNIMKVTYPMEKLDAILTIITIALTTIGLIIIHNKPEENMIETYILLKEDEG